MRDFSRYGKRARGGERLGQDGYNPPETWHEPSERPAPDYRIVEQPAGSGYRHVLTAAEVRARLSELPPEFLRGLEVVQFSQMTRKKLGFPCYGMQWGTAIYLYPIEESRVERFLRTPGPAQRNEARMYGGKWIQAGDSGWELRWSEDSIRDYYLNNILIHELGHLVDRRNTGYADRERFAEWFALEYGYKSPQRRRMAAQRPVAAQPLVRRHHKSAW